MLIVAIAWIYVVGMAALAEALSPQGSVLGAVFTFLLYGALPLSIVLYLLGTPGRKRALRQAEAAALPAASGPAGPPSAVPAERTARAAQANDGASLQPDGGGHAPGGAGRGALPVAPEREEP